MGPLVGTSDARDRGGRAAADWGMTRACEEITALGPFRCLRELTVREHLARMARAGTD
jgi:hypothetical protein